MSFLFGKKSKAHNAPTQAPPSGPGPNSLVPRVNGAPNPAAQQVGTPGGNGSINNSIASRAGGQTPSPDHGPTARGGSEQDGQVCNPFGHAINRQTSMVIWTS